MLICWQEDGGGTIEQKLQFQLFKFEFKLKDTLKQECDF